MGNAYRIFVGKTEGKIPLGRPRYRWEDIITDLRETGGLIWLSICTNDRLL
jgi:hypothetical protein